MNTAATPSQAATLVWEEVTSEGSGCYFFRAKVPGGWLVREVQDAPTLMADGSSHSGYHWTTSMVFLPDPQHAWGASA